MFDNFGVKNMFIRYVAALSIVTVFMLAGCAAPQPKLRYVWPPLPEEPKIEYLGVYNNENDIESEGFKAAFLGREPSPHALRNPQMAAGDGKGRVYVTDIKMGGVFVFDFNDRSVSLLGGENAVGLFGQPTGIAFDGDGFLYVADSTKRKITVFTREGRPSVSLDLSDKLKSIGFIAIDKQRKRLIVPDPKDNKIHIVTFQGAITSTITNIDHPEGGFNKPNAVAVTSNGDILVADTFNARIVRFSPDGTFISQFGSRGDNPGQFNIIQGIAIDSSGHIYITDARANRLSIMSEKGELLLFIGSSGDSLSRIGVFEIPFGISIDQNDTIYIVEKYFSRFQKYQYFSADYRAKNPLKTEELAKPVEADKKDPKNKAPLSAPR